MAAGRGNDGPTGARPFDTSVEPDGTAWAVVTPIDGRRHVISRHPTREMAEHAATELNASGNRTNEFTAHDVLPRDDGTFDA